MAPTLIPRLRFNKPDRGAMLNRNHPLSRGLVGFWLFNEGGGLKAYDVSGFNNTGELTNGPIWQGGKFGNAINFDGVNDYVNTNVNLNLLTQVTFSAWIFSKVSGQIGVMGNDNGSFGRIIRGSFTTLEILNTTGIAGSSSTDLPLNTWVHVTVTWSTSAVKLYLNGSLDRSFNGEAATYDDAITTRIGHTGPGGAGQFFTGLIDSVRIYNRVLTGAEVMWLYREPFADLLWVNRRTFWFVAAGAADVVGGVPLSINALPPVALPLSTRAF